MNEKGFSYVEVLVSLNLMLITVLLVGAMNMTSLKLLGNGKINQRATLLLLQKIEQLRSLQIQDLTDGIFEEFSGIFLIRWHIESHVPYLGTKKIHCQVFYQPASKLIVESIFYRSE